MSKAFLIIFLIFIYINLFIVDVNISAGQDDTIKLMNDLEIGWRLIKLEILVPQGGFPIYTLTKNATILEALVEQAAIDQGLKNGMVKVTYDHALVAR